MEKKRTRNKCSEELTLILIYFIIRIKNKTNWERNFCIFEFILFPCFSF